MKKHFKKFIVMGLFIVLTNLFWDSISQELEKNHYVKKSIQYVEELLESKEPPFHAIASTEKKEQKLKLILKEEAFVYLLSKSPTQTKLLFPSISNSFNQYNPNISYELLVNEKHKILYLVASREPLTFSEPKVFLEKINTLKRLGKLDFVELKNP